MDGWKRKGKERKMNTHTHSNTSTKMKTNNMIPKFSHTNTVAFNECLSSLIKARRQDAETNRMILKIPMQNQPMRWVRRK